MERETILQLKNAAKPFLFFWSEWIEDSSCTLSSKETDIINVFIKDNFQPVFIESSAAPSEAQIVRIIAKLQASEPIFRDFVACDFLFTLIEIARVSHMGFSKFLTTDICHIPISQALMSCLLHFKISSIDQLPVFYRGEDLSNGYLYSIIMKYQIQKKASKILISHLIYINEDNNNSIKMQ